MSPQQTQMEAIQALAQAAATLAVSSVLNLGNCIESQSITTQNRTESPSIEEEKSMPSKVRHEIKMDDGRIVTICGNNLSEAINKALPRLNNTVQTPFFSEYAEQWVQLYFIPNAGACWQREANYIMKKHLLPYFGTLRLSEINLNEVQRFFNLKRSLAESTNKHIKYLLSGVLTSAVEDELIARDYTKSTRLVISKKKTEREALTLEQVEDILENMKYLSEEQQLILALLFFTGIRRGELLALRWGDVDLKNGLIHITHAVSFDDGNHPVLKEPKSKSGIRNIPITPELAVFLHPGKKEVFLIGGGLKPITERSYICRFANIRKSINLYGATAHVLRHTFSTMAAEHLDPKTLQRIMGHSKLDITMNRYTHTQDRLVNTAGEKLKGMYQRSSADPMSHESDPGEPEE